MSVKRAEDLTPAEQEAIMTGTAVEQVPWTEELVMRRAGATGLPRAEAVERLNAAGLSPGMADALVAAGWSEFDPLA